MGTERAMDVSEAVTTSLFTAETEPQIIRVQPRTIDRETAH